MKMFCTLLILLNSFQTMALESLDFREELTANELTQTLEYPLVKTEKSKGAWPIVSLYQVIDASPLESVAIFYALDYQKEYVPNLIVSEVVKMVSPTIAHTKYEMKMPWPISNSTYIHASELSAQKPSSYKVRWWMVESSSAEKVDGYAIFIPYKDKTLMKYWAHVKPKSFLASFVKNKMVEDVTSSLIATKKEIEEVKINKKDILRKYVTYIDDALSGKKVY